MSPFAPQPAAKPDAKPDAAATAAAAPLAAPAPGPNASAPRPPARAPPPMPPGAKVYDVVLADDVAALRRLVKLATEASGRFRVVAEAGNGLEAIERSREHQPHLVLLDLSMPELDGLEALPRVLEASPSSHVVVLSGFNQARMAPVAKRMGASAYLEKGLEPGLLVQALLQVLEPHLASSAAPIPATPLVQARPPRPPQPEFRHDAASLPAPMQPAGPAVRVLVVQADQGAADRLAHLMQQANAARFQCSHADSLHAAALRLEARTADLVLLDPRGLANSADDAFLEILSRAAGVPVVALVPHQDITGVARALRLGIEDCLDPDAIEADLLGRSLLYAVERRRSQDARRQLRDQQAELERLRQMEALKTQFFNAAAHELGTPLTPIRLQVALLRKLGRDSGRLGPVEQRSLEILERNVDRMAKLNQDILDVARLQAGRLPVEKHAMDLKAALHETMETFEPVARDGGIGLTATCPDGILLHADQQRLVQVLFNLVNNALKFTPRGGVVALDCRLDADQVHIAVRDSGIGLRPEQIARLFQPFSQVLGEDQPRGIGTGLGLFVSRGIVELHGGHIACASPGPGLGTTFTITLPRLAGKSEG